MNKILFIFLALILFACTPQVTVTSTATLPPPTETLIPTPTLHPEFIALQNFMASSERYILLPDGTIEELTIDGGRKTVPNLHVDQNSVINIIFNNEYVAIEQTQITFDDEKGLTVEGYELENGNWVEVASPAMTMATELLGTYGIDPETVTVTEESAEKGSVVQVMDKETEKVLWSVDRFGARYGLEFAVDGIAAKSCDPTPFKPTKRGLMPGEYAQASSDYMQKIKNELNYPRIDGAHLYSLLLVRDEQCWGQVYNGKDLLYRDNDGVARRLPLIKLTKEEIEAFQVTR